MRTQTHLPQVCDAILAYLQQHPGAADTAQGIARWWMPEAFRGNEAMVSRALDALLAQGRIHRYINADQHMIYSGLGGKIIG